MIKGYYFITDAGLSREGNLSDVQEALRASVNAVQYRNKSAMTLDLYREALALRRICKSIMFVINDRVDIALAVDADGVHLGQDDLSFPVARKLLGKKKIIGLTVHSVNEALQAQKIGADYLGVSPIFATRTKSDAGKSIGLEGLRAIRRRVALPIVAIGGIDLSNVDKVIAAGADAICAISAVVIKPDVRAEIKKFQRLFNP